MLFHRNKIDPDTVLLSRVINLINNKETKPNERKILLYVKHQCEHHVYYPNIVFHLKLVLTPMAMKSELSNAMGKLYCDIIAGNVANSGIFRTGVGMGSVYGSFFK